MLRLERIGKIYPTGEVLRDVTWEVKAGDRIGLVVKQGAPRIVYLQQEFDVDLRRTVRQELFQAFGEAAEVLNRQSVVEEAMAVLKDSVVRLAIFSDM